jgi:hypothetical protein
MALVEANLATLLERIFREIEEEGIKGDLSPEDLRKMKAQRMAAAIHQYVSAAQVVTSNGVGTIIGVSPTGPVTGVATLVSASGKLI